MKKSCKKIEEIERFIGVMKAELNDEVDEVEQKIIGALLVDPSLMKLFRYDFQGIKRFFSSELHRFILRDIYLIVEEKSSTIKRFELSECYKGYIELAKKSKSTEIKEFERKCKILHDYENRRAWLDYALDIIISILKYPHDLSANPYQKFEYKKSSPVIPNLIVE